MHVLLTPAVLLLSGVINGDAGYMTHRLVIMDIILPHNLKSLDDVTLRQVGYMTYGLSGATENAGVVNAIRAKLQGWKMQEWKRQE